MTMYYAQWTRHGETHFAEASTMAELEKLVSTHHSNPVYGTAHYWQKEVANA